MGLQSLKTILQSQQYEIRMMDKRGILIGTHDPELLGTWSKEIGEYPICKYVKHKHDSLALIVKFDFPVQM